VLRIVERRQASPGGYSPEQQRKRDQKGRVATQIGSPVVALPSEDAPLSLDAAHVDQGALVFTAKDDAHRWHQDVTFDDGTTWSSDDINARVNEKARELRLP
jgi:hypothetical protein